MPVQQTNTQKRKLKQKEKLIALVIFIGIYLLFYSCLSQWGLVEDTEEITEQTVQINSKSRHLLFGLAKAKL